MFNLIPSNRQEYLLQVLINLLDGDYQASPPRLGVFEPATVLVESLGMQHFIQMGIAKQTQVSMNIEFPLLSRGIYQLCRGILGEDQVPKESLFKREILVWRIEEIFRQTSFIEHPDAITAVNYWTHSADIEKARFLLAQNTADVFEQYMQFRPQWLLDWSGEIDFDGVFPDDQDLLMPWQKLLWQRLVQTNDSYPSKIIHNATIKAQQAIENGTFSQFNLPKVLYIFAVNTFTPTQLDFLKVISSTPELELYFFQLNPCVEYWGDLVSEQALMKQRLKAGLDKLNDEDSPNTLLANLGKQGRVLFNLLQSEEYLDFTDKQLFNRPIQRDSESLSKSPNATDFEQSPSLLHAIQNDLLMASTGTVDGVVQDNSVSIHSCHSAIREIQVLHDHLLHIMQNDSNVKPHDVIVLCPAVEDYAPYVKSVFRSSYQKDNEDSPKLVCSIADRAPLDADPMVSMFMDMLLLPDSRFNITALIDYLHIESVQKSFDLSLSDVELCEIWLKDANVYWAKDAQHKAKVLGVDRQDDTYTWEWGFDRLLKSALHSDIQSSDSSFAMLDNVEGQDLHLLGKLMTFIDTLVSINRGLTTPRTIKEWLNFIKTDILERIFQHTSDSYAFSALNRTLEQVTVNVLNAQHEHKVTLSVIREALNNLLSRPDSLNQFNTGQVTFCSMIPMRSVPFKVVCILGLNDGVFPRSSQPLSIDLMALDTPKNTDRNRRTEDRYMFLEAILSARDYLYLSYQGKSLKNNAERAPSLVLSELIDYVDRAYGIKPIYEHSLQPFSPRAFEKTDNTFARQPSFASDWLNVVSKSPVEIQSISAEFELPAYLSIDDMVSFFSDPLAAFASTHLHLSFERFEDVQNDSEPFAANYLDRYLALSETFQSAIEGSPEHYQEYLDNQALAGRLPDRQTVADYSDMIFIELQQAEGFDYFQQMMPILESQEYSVSLPLDGSLSNIIVHAQDSVDTDCKSMTLLKGKAKDSHFLSFVVKHAVKRLSMERPTTSILGYARLASFDQQLKDYASGKRKSTPKLDFVTIELSDQNFDEFQCRQLLTTMLKYMQKGHEAPSTHYLSFARDFTACLSKIEGFDADAFNNSPLQYIRDLEATDKETLQFEVFNRVQKSSASYSNAYIDYFYPNGLSEDEFDIEALTELYVLHFPLSWSDLK